MSFVLSFASNVAATVIAAFLAATAVGLSVANVSAHPPLSLIPVLAVVLTYALLLASLPRQAALVGPPCVSLAFVSAIAAGIYYEPATLALNICAALLSVLIARLRLPRPSLTRCVCITALLATMIVIWLPCSHFGRPIGGLSASGYFIGCTVVFCVVVFRLMYW